MHCRAPLRLHTATRCACRALLLLGAPPGFAAPLHLPRSVHYLFSLPDVGHASSRSRYCCCAYQHHAHCGTGCRHACVYHLLGSLSRTSPRWVTAALSPPVSAAPRTTSRALTAIAARAAALLVRSGFARACHILRVPHACRLRFLAYVDAHSHACARFCGSSFFTVVYWLHAYLTAHLARTRHSRLPLVARACAARYTYSRIPRRHLHRTRACLPRCHTPPSRPACPLPSAILRVPLTSRVLPLPLPPLPATLHLPFYSLPHPALRRFACVCPHSHVALPTPHSSPVVTFHLGMTALHLRQFTVVVHW